jgi:hypothetical protein
MFVKIEDNFYADPEQISHFYIASGYTQTSVYFKNKQLVLTNIIPEEINEIIEKYLMEK